ncbi:alpha/beta hydrolase [Bradyrhizobium sp. LHD-71]|uniref:alpha/beta hydrolase n=1 Tax=Bradyrhizobium sp. LHD-71 TaxID=3072141 RepID=UPI00280FC6F8|nr:alpha/beta hydrolase [Bradyrhizobium sp. LHD-71]MDQ8726919.1 alpha/beta hydrolase [Bradyrhizobium sp. LHD-71]
MILLRWAACLVLLYVAVVAVMYAAQRMLLYPIPQTTRTTPAAAGFGEAEEVVAHTRDGEQVILWHVPPKAGRPVVIFFHGNGEVLAWRVPRFRALTADGTGLVALSFRGYAGSTGKPTEQGLLDDGAAAYAFAAGRYSPDRIVPWGYSLGSGVAIAVATTQPVGGVILEAAYTSIVDVAASAYPFLPVRWLMRDRFQSDARIGALQAPLLVMHGEKDSVVSIAFGRRLYELAPGKKRFVVFENGTHLDLDSQGAIGVARAFLEEIGQKRE